MSQITRPKFVDVDQNELPHTVLASQNDFIKARVFPNGLAEIILDRPKVLNAVDFFMVKEIYRIVSALEADPDVKCLVIMSAIDKAFCAGGDVVSLISQTDYRLAMIFFRVQYVMHLALAQTHLTVISLMRGIVMGGGAGLAMSCRFRLASETVSFAMPETQIGLFPDVGHTYILPQLPFGVGLYAGLTSARLSAGDVTHLGLATHYIPESTIPALLQVLRTRSLAVKLGYGPFPATNHESRTFNPHRISPVNEEQQHLFIASIIDRFAAPSPRRPFQPGMPSDPVPIRNAESKDSDAALSTYSATSSGVESPITASSIPPSKMLQMLPIISAIFVGNKSLSELVSRLRNWADLALLLEAKARGHVDVDDIPTSRAERRLEGVKQSALVRKVLTSMIQFAKSTLETLKVKSILSLIVTFHLFKVGQTSSCLAECQAREYRVISRIVQRAHLYSDLHEGVRALLVEKGKRPPVWRDPRAVISEEALTAYGSQLGNYHAGVKPVPGLSGATVDLVLGGDVGSVKEAERLQTALEVEEAVIRRLVAPLPRQNTWEMDMYDYFADAAKGGRLMYAGEEFMHNGVFERPTTPGSKL